MALRDRVHVLYSQGLKFDPQYSMALDVDLVALLLDKVELSGFYWDKISPLNTL